MFCILGSEESDEESSGTSNMPSPKYVDDWDRAGTLIFTHKQCQNSNNCQKNVIFICQQHRLNSRIFGLSRF